MGAIPWGAALYFSKRTHKPFFSQIAKPSFFPGYIAIHLVTLIVSLLYAVGFYNVWARHGGWSGEPVALALVCGAQFLAVVGAFVTWVWFSPWSVMIGGAITILAGVAAVVSSVWIFWAESLDVAFWYALIAAAWYMLLGAAMIFLGYYGNNYKVDGPRCCPRYVGGGKQWPPVEYCEDACPETGPAGTTCFTNAPGGVVTMEGGAATGIKYGGAAAESKAESTPGDDSRPTASQLGAIGLNVQDCFAGSTQKVSVRSFASAPSSAASKRNN